MGWPESNRDPLVEDGGAIANIQNNVKTVIDDVHNLQPTAQFAVASYRDIEDIPPFKVVQQLTGDVGLAPGRHRALIKR